MFSASAHQIYMHSWSHRTDGSPPCRRVIRMLKQCPETETAHPAMMYLVSQCTDEPPTRNGPRPRQREHKRSSLVGLAWCDTANNGTRLHANSPKVKQCHRSWSQTSCAPGSRIQTRSRSFPTPPPLPVKLRRHCRLTATTPK